MRFGIKTSEVVIDGDTYIFKPLKGKHLGLLMDVAKRLSAEKIDEDDDKADEKFMNMISQELVNDINTLAMETFKISYPSEFNKDPETIELFVTQNLFKLLNPIIEVNTGK